MITGVLLGVASAAFFGIAAVFIRIGMKFRTRDDGLFMTLLVNVVVMGLVMPFVDLPPWNWSAAASFMLAGLLATLLGRTASFRAIRRIGASRSNAFLMSAPLFSAVGGWLILGERITAMDALGAGVVFVALGMLVRSRVVAESLVPEPQEGQSITAISMDDAGGSVKPRERKRLVARLDKSPRGGYAYAALAPLLFGSAFVARKWGIIHYPSPVAGAFLGVMTSLTFIIVLVGLGGHMPSLAEQNLRRVPWWFVAGGAALSAALLLQFFAFLTLPAWLVSLLVGTQGLWTLFWSALFIRREEHIGWELIVSVILVMIGIGIITLRP